MVSTISTRVAIVVIFGALVLYLAYLVVVWKMMKSWIERTVRKWLRK